MPCVPFLHDAQPAGLVSGDARGRLSGHPLETDASGTCLWKALALPTLQAGWRDLLLRFQGTCFCVASHIHSCCNLYSGTLKGSFTDFIGERKQVQWGPRGLLYLSASPARLLQSPSAPLETPAGEG